jgi:hypothetical protein
MELWKLPKGDDFLPGVSIQELRRLYRVEKRAKPKLRLLCAIHRKEGKSIDDMAGYTNMKRDCPRYVVAFRGEGDRGQGQHQADWTASSHGLCEDGHEKEADPPDDIITNMNTSTCSEPEPKEHSYSCSPKGKHKRNL